MIALVLYWLFAGVFTWGILRFLFLVAQFTRMSAIGIWGNCLFLGGIGVLMVVSTFWMLLEEFLQLRHHIHFINFITVGASFEHWNNASTTVNPFHTDLLTKIRQENSIDYLFLVSVILFLHEYFSSLKQLAEAISCLCVLRLTIAVYKLPIVINRVSHATPHLIVSNLGLDHFKFDPTWALDIKNWLHLFSAAFSCCTVNCCSLVCLLRIPFTTKKLRQNSFRSLCFWTIAIRMFKEFADLLNFIVKLSIAVDHSNETQNFNLYLRNYSSSMELLSKAATGHGFQQINKYTPYHDYFLFIITTVRFTSTLLLCVLRLKALIICLREVIHTRMKNLNEKQAMGVDSFMKIFFMLTISVIYRYWNDKLTNFKEVIFLLNPIRRNTFGCLVALFQIFSITCFGLKNFKTIYMYFYNEDQVPFYEKFVQFTIKMLALGYFVVLMIDCWTMNSDDRWTLNLTNLIPVFFGISIFLVISIIPIYFIHAHNASSSIFGFNAEYDELIRKAEATLARKRRLASRASN
ncbi:hypothetical protein Ciccas_010912 [Cichlidogyrus casuarinus]|uniref:Uncharacterized protein n=1 Tax=Cichlidogyrus casuarinus TaxID=1844966 RepID=A0ABD2PVN4_9PLAT